METEIGADVKVIRKRKRVKRPNGRPLQYPDKTIVRMPKGSLKRINAAIKATGEYQGDFMRMAVEKELKLRRV